MQHVQYKDKIFTERKKQSEITFSRNIHTPQIITEADALPSPECKKRGKERKQPALWYVVELGMPMCNRWRTEIQIIGFRRIRRSAKLFYIFNEKE